MTGKKVEVFLMTAILAVTALFFGMAERPLDFSFLAVTEEKTEEIKPWRNENGEIFVFLPSYADLSQLLLKSSNPVYFDEIKVENGDQCIVLQPGRAYALPDGSKLTFLQSKNIPAMYVDTESGTMEKIQRGKWNTKEAGQLRLYSEAGDLHYTGKLRTIESRGNATFRQDKKPYNLKLTEPGDLLGMGAAQNWVLLADYLDNTHIRNKMVFDFAKEIGLRYSPDSQWVDLYLNGEYAGLYLLAEHNELHPQRIAISENEGILVSKERHENVLRKKVPYILTDAGAALRIRACTVEKKHAEQIFQSAENAILAENGIDPVTGKHWTELIDLDSWVRKYLVEEIFGGYDAGCYSQFFYYDGLDGKIFAGPVWDYDFVLTNQIWAGWGSINVIPEMMFAHRIYWSPWFHKLCDDKIFYMKLEELYKEECVPALDNIVEKKIPEYASKIFPAAHLDRIRWHGSDFLGEIEILQRNLKTRMDFLNDIWINKDEYAEVSVKYNFDENFDVHDFYVRKGECLPEFLLNKVDKWYDAKTDIPFDIAQPIYKDIQIYNKPEDLSTSVVPIQKNYIFLIPLVLLMGVGTIVLFVIDIQRAKKNNVILDINKPVGSHDRF